MAADPYVRALFAEGVKLVFSAHHQGSDQALANVDTSSLPKLKQMLRAGSKANLKQAERLAPVFKALKLPMDGKTDRAMNGIADANNGLIARADNRATRDLANIGSGQVAAHYFIATYTTLRSYAVSLGLRDAVSVFDKTLAETRKIERDLGQLGKRVIAQASERPYPANTSLFASAAENPGRTVLTVLGVAAAGAATLIMTARPPEPKPRRLGRLWRR